MTVILILLSLIVLLLMDQLRGNRHVVRATTASALMPTDEVPARLRPNVVGGFQVPGNVRFHPGHTWALKESPTLVRVGLDDFSAKLLGPVEKIVFPQRGQWIRQGQRFLSIQRRGGKVDLVSPIEGSISEVNDALGKDPTLAVKDPYGDGWLLTVQAPDAGTNFRNLLGGALARSWMEEAAARLRGRMPQMAGALAQDGGVAADDLGAQLPEDKFAEIAHEFFLC